MKSMTGFGAATGRAGGRGIIVEISSLNSKRGLDLSINLPREAAAAEKTLRKAIEKSMERGRICVNIQLTGENNKSAKLKIDEEAAKNYHRQLKRLARNLKCAPDVSLEYILTLPDVMKFRQDDPDPMLDRSITAVFRRALNVFMRARAREGSVLSRDLIRRIGQIERDVAKVARRGPIVIEQYRQSLLRKIEEAGLPVDLADERLSREIVLFADRSDTSEETARLRSHCAEAKRILRSTMPGGKTLDFLIQEMGRETNTIASKANDLEITQAAVRIKTELEKIREQTQNLE
jgi:uncharacterized protein (TIGR00255 family)